MPNLHKGGIREPTSWLKDAGSWRKDTERLALPVETQLG